MKKNVGIFAIFTLLMGCATSTTFLSPDGDTWHEINCSGSAMQISDCYKKASEVCKGNYNVVEKKEAEAGGVLVPTQFGLTATSNSKRSLIIQCKQQPI